MGAWRFLLAGMIGCVLAGALQAPAGAAPAKPQYTSAEYFRDVLACERRLLPESYRAHGKRNPKWDAAAEAALDMLARQLAGVNVSTRVCIPADLAVYRGMLKPVAQKAIDLGCDDALVIYAMAVSLSDAGDPQGVPWMEKAYRAALASGYPRGCHVGVFSRMREMSSDERVRTEAWTHQQEAVGQLVAGEMKGRGDRRLIFNLASILVKSVPVTMRNGVLDRLGKVKGADAWIMNVLRAEREKDEAWEARGSDWAGNVTAKGWQGFREHLNKARAYALAAHKAHPEYPEAATTLIVISMGQSDREGVTDWFKAAQAAQADFRAAFNAECMALLPRWGGSLEQIIQIGLEASQSDRYDSGLPFELICAGDRVIWDNPKRATPLQFWSMPQVRQVAVKVLEGYARQLKGRPEAGYYLTYRAVLESAAGDDNKARECLDEAGKWVDDGILTRLGQSRVRFEDRVYVRTSPQGDGVMQADALLSRHRVDEARKVIDQTLTEMKPGDPLRRSAIRLRALADFDERYNRGDWASLLIGEQGGPWVSDQPYTVENGAVVTGGPGCPFTLALDTDVDDRGYEVVMKLELPPQKFDKNEMVGVEVGMDRGGRGYAVAVAPAYPAVISKAPEATAGGFGSPVPAENEIHVIYWDGTITATVNGKPVKIVTSPTFDPASMGKLTSIRAGAVIERASCPKVRITELKMRKLTRRPE